MSMKHPWTSPVAPPSPRLSTLPVQIYNYIEFTSDPTIAAISALLIVLTVGAVLLVERLVGFTRFV